MFHSCIASLVIETLLSHTHTKMGLRLLNQLIHCFCFLGTAQGHASNPPLAPQPPSGKTPPCGCVWVWVCWWWGCRAWGWDCGEGWGSGCPCGSGGYEKERRTLVCSGYQTYHSYWQNSKSFSTKAIISEVHYCTLPHEKTLNLRPRRVNNHNYVWLCFNWASENEPHTSVRNFSVCTYVHACRHACVWFTNCFYPWSNPTFEIFSGHILHIHELHALYIWMPDYRPSTNTAHSRLPHMHQLLN